MTTLLDRLGASEGVAQRVFTWNEMDRTRESATVQSLTATGSTTIGIETNIDISSNTLGYFIVGDVIRTPSGVLGRVEAVGSGTDFGLTGSANNQAIQVIKEGGGNWASGDIATSDVIGHAHNSFGEASDAPYGRLYLPAEEYNYLTTLRRSFSISGSEFTNRTWLGDGSAWYFTVEDIEMKEFARDRENAIFFGKRSEIGNRTETRGLLDFVLSNGVNNGYASATGVTETDLQEHIKDLVVEGSSNEMWVLCGANFMKQVQVALRDYAVAGAMNYGKLGNNVAGLDFTQYLFMGKRINFMHYVLFNDSKVVPYSDTPSASKINFDDFSIWLDFGADVNGRSNIVLKHKELDGQSRKFIHAYEVGMMNPEGANGGLVSNGKDAFTIHYLSEIGIEVRNSHRMGILRADS